MAINKVVYGSETLIDLTEDTATADTVADGYTLHLSSGIKATGTAKYAGSAVANGSAIKTAGIPYGECDSTSTSTVFTATIDGITSLYDGVCVMLKNGVVTSASGFTININGLGAKPVYSSMATGNDVTPTNPTRETTIFNINYTLLLIYSEDLVDGGAWINYRGYDANTNTIGYQLRTNSGNLVASDAGYKYRLWFTSADGAKWVPANTSTSTNATTARTLNTRAINPFGDIVYNSTNGTTASGTRPTATALWQQYALTVGYSYVLSMTAWEPVYLRCTPQSDGSAVMDVLTQTLPTTKDGKIYIFLGIAYSATAMELEIEHPVYWHDGTGIRIWTGAEPNSGGSTVSVTQTLTSGTKIGTVSVDGTGTDLYAPTPPTAPSITTLTVTIATSDWSNNTCTKNVSGVTASNTVIVTYAPASKDAYTGADIYCSAQGAGTLTFNCTTAPTEAVTVNVMIVDGATNETGLISFTVGEIGTYTAEAGMTWRQWVASEYNTNSFYISGNSVYINSSKSVIASLDDVIINGNTYGIMLSGGSND